MKTVVLAVVLVLLIGCTPIERTAYNTVVASKAFLDSVKAKHPECPSASTLCTKLASATASKDLIIDAGKAYCHVDQFANTDKTPCMPSPKGTPALTQTLSALQSAMTGYSQAEKDLKGVIQ